MRLILVVLIAALVAGWVTGGHLRGIAAVPARWPGLALVALALQFGPSSGPQALPLVHLSLLLMGAFALRNLRLPGFPLILLGAVANFTVIAVNAGMPVSRAATIASGQAETLPEIERDDDGVRHHLIEPEDRLLFLADVISVPAPISQTISAGDIALYGGIAWFLCAAMRRGEPAGPVTTRASPTVWTR